jgi:F-type H+-transporting ATPase subunit delta
MSEYKVSKRYAVSLLESAGEKKLVDAVYGDMQLIAATLGANKELIHVLSSPIIRPNVKLTILEEIFKSRVNSDTMAFLKFLVDKNRENLLENIAKIFLDLKDEQDGIVNVEVKAPEIFTEDQLEKFKANLEKTLDKKVRLNLKIDSEIIGGFVAKVGDTVFDASLKHQLELLKKQLLKGGASLN